MNLFYYIILFFLVLSLLNLAWPLIIGLLIFLLINYLSIKIRLKRQQHQEQKRQEFYETVEPPKQGLDIIDVEYEEKK